MPSTPPNFTPLGTPSSSSGPQPLPPHPPFFCKTNLPGSPELQLGPFTLPPLLPLFAKQTQSTPIRHFAKQTQVRSAPPPTGMPPTPTPHFCKTNPPGNPERLLGPSPFLPSCPFLQNKPNLHPNVILQNKPKSGRRPRRPESASPFLQNEPNRHPSVTLQNEPNTLQPSAHTVSFCKTNPPPSSLHPPPAIYAAHFPSPYSPSPTTTSILCAPPPFPEFHPCLKNPCI